MHGPSSPKGAGLFTLHTTRRVRPPDVRSPQPSRNARGRARRCCRRGKRMRGRWLPGVATLVRARVCLRLPRRTGEPPVSLPTGRCQRPTS